MPGSYDPRFATHGYLRHPLDGLCEPSCTRLIDGDLLLVMRLGSLHPLYVARSSDNGRTWGPPADRRPGCYYETWPARPIAVHGILPTVLTLSDGTLALCSGRPDATLSFSFDNGDHWPVTHRFIEDNKPEEQSSFNNTMVQVAPNRLLFAYDHGGNSGKIPEYSHKEHKGVRAGPTPARAKQMKRSLRLLIHYGGGPPGPNLYLAQQAKHGYNPKP